jgi:hypothetical protein
MERRAVKEGIKAMEEMDNLVDRLETIILIQYSGLPER